MPREMRLFAKRSRPALARRKTARTHYENRRREESHRLKYTPKGYIIEMQTTDRQIPSKGGKKQHEQERMCAP